jgi:hypothetical protein
VYFSAGYLVVNRWNATDFVLSSVYSVSKCLLYNGKKIFNNVILCWRLKKNRNVWEQVCARDAMTKNYSLKVYEWNLEEYFHYSLILPRKRKNAKKLVVVQLKEHSNLVGNI